MGEGVHLPLMVGPRGAEFRASQRSSRPVQEVKIESVRARRRADSRSPFRISNRSPLHTLFLLTGGASIPILRVVIAVTVRGSTTC